MQNGTACGSFEGFVSKMEKEKLHVQTATLRMIWKAAPLKAADELKITPVSAGN